MKHKKPTKIKKLLNSKKPLTILPTTHTTNIAPNFQDYFTINHNLIPPFSIILDTNFINFSIKKKLDIKLEMLKCLNAGIKLLVTDCVVAELEKLGRIYAVALKLVKDICERLTCDHKGTYADDCIVKRVSVHRCFIVATCDTELKQRIRKIPGVPIVYVMGYKYEVEKLPRAVIKHLY